MHRKLLLSLAMTLVGAGLLVAAGAASPAGKAPAKAGSTDAKRGGTLRLNTSNTDFEYIDPALSYDAIGWSVLYATNLMLLNYPDKPAPAGSRLVPEAATGFPVVSRDGKTYTFTIRKGLRFSDGSAVSAASFKAAIERNANPTMQSPSIAFMHDIVGVDARAEGRASSVSGVVAKGNKLTIRLTKNNPTLIAELAMPFFTAIKPGMAIDPKGLNSFPSAGPYRIASRDAGRQLVLERNQFYNGTRPANPDRIVITTNTDLNQSLLQVRAGQVDLDLSGLPPTAHDELARLYGVKKSGDGRYFVNSYNGTQYLALNTSRPAFSNVNVRRAVNFGIDRPALVRVAGKFSGKRTDQILPPSLAGFRDAKLYPIKGADPVKAKQLLGGFKGEITLLHTTSATSIARTQVLQYNLSQIGLDVKLKPQPFGVAIKTAGTKGADFDAFLIGWVADYPDPFDFINVLLDGNNIQDANNSNYSYFRNEKYTRMMNDAAKLSGNARYAAYGKLDIDIMKNVAPWAAYTNQNSRELISARTTNYIYSPVYAGAILNALALK